MYFTLLYYIIFINIKNTSFGYSQSLKSVKEYNSFLHLFIKDSCNDLKATYHVSSHLSFIQEKKRENT